MYTRCVPEASAEWVVHGHEPIEELAENLWRVRGVVPGAPLDRVMTVVRLATGDLVIHSAITLDERSMARLEAFGRPRYLVVPNRFHRLDAPRFKRRYPNLTVVCPPGGKRAISGRVAVDGGYDLLPTDPRVRMSLVEGTGEGEGVLEVKSDAGTTLVVNDLIFNMPHRTGFGGFVLKHVTDSSGGPRLTRITRLALIKDKPKVRAALLAMAETENLVRVIVSHHEPLVGDVRGQLQALAATL